jgi:hypothetical protein
MFNKTSDLIGADRRFLVSITRESNLSDSGGVCSLPDFIRCL